MQESHPGKGFSTFLTLTLLCFVGISIALVVGSSYGLLSRTMNQEFYNRIEAKKTSVGLMIEERLDRVERELEKLGMDNAVRVSLKLGVRSKLDELLGRANSPHDGVFFAVVEKDSDTFIPALPMDIEITRPQLELLGGVPKTQRRPFIQIDKDRYYCLFASPIRSNQEWVGTAFAIYDLSKDQYFWVQGGFDSRYDLIMRQENRLVSLRQAARIETSDPRRNPIPKALKSPLDITIPDTLLLPVKGTKGMYLAASTLDLKDRKTSLVWKFSGLCLVIFLCTLLVSYFIARKVSQPLQSMADQAIEIAKTPTTAMLDEEEIRHLEFKKLAHAFNQVVSSLLESQAELARNAQRKLDASERKYQTLVENSPAGLFTTDVNFNIRFANQTLETITGYPIEELCQMKFKDLIHSGDWEKMIPFGGQIKNRAIRLKKERFEVRWLKKAGRLIWVELLITPVEENGEHLFQVYVTDISERKLAEDALRESEKRLRSIFHNAAVGIVLIDPTGHFIEFNETWSKMLGYSRQELLRRTVRDITPKDDVILDMETPEKADLAMGKYFRLEKRYLKKDGTVIWGDVCATLIYDRRGNPEAILAIILDITENKLVQQERVRLATAVEQTAESVIITDSDRVIQYVNPAFERMSGFSRQEVIGKKPEMIWSHQHDDKFIRELLSTLSSGGVWKGKVTNRRKDGTLFETETTISPIRDKSGTIANFVNIKRDVTHESRLEKQLAQAQKMQAIGTLAGGIAHDFNNILSAIMGYTEMCLIEAPEETQIPRRLERVMNACQRAKELVKQILTFSRQSNQERNEVQIHLIVKEALKLLRASLPVTIEIEQDIHDETGFILADPTQIHQVLMNLCTNAAHAMREKGGVLRVRLDSLNLDREMVSRYLDLEPGAYIRLTVNDTGHGMNRETLERIFEPFFTTKEHGEGTGMGLAVVHGIVKSHAGAIRAYSEPGKGTSFQIYFPRTSQEKYRDSESQQPLPRGKERILVVDDEEFVVDMATEMLEHLGYEVTTRMNSQEALELFTTDPYRFDLVITDQTMPKLTGAELSRKILSLRPEMPIILCTGFSEVITPEKARSSGIKAFIMKPFVTREIARTVRKALGES